MDKPRVSNEELEREARRAENTLEGKFPVESWPVFSRYAMDLLDARRDLAASQQRCRELEGDAERLDWCAANKATAVTYGDGWRVQNVYSVYMTDSHTTARAAIAAAIAAQRQKEGE